MLIFKNKFEKFAKANKTTWLILSAITLLLFLESCSTPSTMRHHNTPNQKGFFQKPIKVKNNTNSFLYANESNEILNIYDNLYDPIGEFQKLIESNNLKPNNNNTNSNKIETQIAVRLPSLREQMNKFSKEQVNINQSIESINADVNTIKEKLNTIENAIPIIQNNNKRSPVKKKDEPKNIDIAVYSKQAVAKRDSDRILAKSKFENQEYEETIQLLTELLLTEKNDEILDELYYMTAMSYYNNNQHQEALPYFEKIMKSANNTYKPLAYLFLTDALAKADTPNNRTSIYQDLIAKYPEVELKP